MPDILIRGMEMPDNCNECSLCAFIPVGEYGLERKCMPLNRNAEIVIRRKDCPLVELPPHGALIDRDAACERYKHDPEKPEICDGAQDLDWLVKCLNEAPVIVPASEEANHDEP